MSTYKQFKPVVLLRAGLGYFSNRNGPQKQIECAILAFSIYVLSYVEVEPLVLFWKQTKVWQR